MRYGTLAVAGVTLALTAGGPTGWAAPAQTSSGGDDRIRRMEQEVLRRVNDMRQEQGLAPRGPRRRDAR